MRKRSRTREDENEAAFRVVAEATAEGRQPVRSAVSAAAAALGRTGGLKGGPARAAKLTAAERSESASKAALARWKKRAPAR
jgi:hypothetical protein